MKQKSGDIEFTLARRKVKNLRIQVRPDGAVEVVSPQNLDQRVINDFVLQRTHWIKKHQDRFKNLPGTQKPAFTTGETHMLWGKSYTLELKHQPHASHVDIAAGDVLQLWVDSSADSHYRGQVLDAYYRRCLNHAIPKLLAKWEPIIKKQASSFYIRKMTSRWGSCNVITARIAFNLELAKKPLVCLEYVTVHELVHLLEASHNARFKAFMDQFLPDWRERKKLLNAS